MKLIIASLMLVLVAAIASAQEKKVQNPWQFHSINNIGFLEGETGSAFQWQTVNGAQFKSWYAGIGVGLDYYRYRTIPLFVDVRKEFFTGADKLFVYADGGISFSWVTDAQKIGYLNEHFSNGFYNDLGLGYKRQFGKNNALLLSIGYSFKRVVESYDQLNNIDYFRIYIYQAQKTNYSLNRLSIKIGWEF